MKQQIQLLALTALLANPLCAQELAPGYIDPYPVLQAASAAIGEDRLRCVSISGTAYSGMVGQQRLNGYEVDWPRGEPLRNYTRLIDWQNVGMLETFDREPGNNPASWKYGLGWQGGMAIQQQTRQEFMLNGDYAWHKDGEDGAPVAASQQDSERWQLDMWLTPHGFLKAARLPGANPRATWRWELGEMGRDGATVNPEKVTIVSIDLLGKYRVDATINSQNLLQRIHTWVPDPVLGDTNYEHEFANAEFVETVEVNELAAGVYLLGGSSHNSVAVEFADYIAVVEAPLNERRNLAVIDRIVELIPGKPIRFLVNTHQHHDHIGGLRTYMHIGATIITHWKNYDFYSNDVLNYAPRTLDPDMVSLWPPTELAEGYQYETVRENYVLTDGNRNLNISYVHPLSHVEGMLVAYLPEEMLLVEADLFDGPSAVNRDALSITPNQSHRSLYNHVQRLGMGVDTLVPIHGEPTSWDDFEELIN